MIKQLNQVEIFHRLIGQKFGKVPHIPNEEAMELRFKLFNEEVIEWSDGCVDNDLPNVAKELADILYIWCGAVLECGCADIIEEVFDAVHESNMSKLDDKGLPIFREDGKLLKGPNYEKANIESIIYKPLND